MPGRSTLVAISPHLPRSHISPTSPSGTCLVTQLWLRATRRAACAKWGGGVRSPQISPDLLRSRPPPYLPQISPRGEVVTAQAHREPTPWRAPLQTWHSHHVPLARCVLRQVTALAHISSRSFRHVLATGWARGLRLWKDEEAKNSTTSLFGRYRISPYLPQIPPRSPPGLHTSPPDLPQSSPFYGLL